jgi:WD40 repeat protein
MENEDSRIRRGSSIEGGSLLYANHFSAEAAFLSKDQKMTASILNDIDPYLPLVKLKKIISQHHPEDCSFSPDGEKCLAVNSTFATISIWDTKTYKQIGRINAQMFGGAVGFTLGENQIITSYFGSLSYWDLKTCTQMGHEIFIGYDYSRPSFSPSGTLIASGMSQSSTVSLRNVVTGKVLILTGHKEGIIESTFSQDSKIIVTTSEDSTVRLWNTATGLPIGRAMKHKNWVRQANISPDGKLVLTAGWDNAAHLWDPIEGKEITNEMLHRSELRKAIFSPDGKTIITLSDDNIVKFWDFVKRSLSSQKFQLNATIHDAKFSSDAKALLITADSAAQFFDAVTLKSIGRAMNHDSTIKISTLSRDGKLCLIVTESNKVHLWKAGTGKEFCTPWVFQEKVNNAVFNPDGTMVLIAVGNTAVRKISKMGKRSFL